MNATAGTSALSGWRVIGVILVTTLAVGTTGPRVHAVQQAADHVLHGSPLQATDAFVERFAHFAWSIGTGKFDLLGDPFDDVVCGAIDEDDPNPAIPDQPFTNLGACYPFRSDGTTLVHHPNHPRVVPFRPEANMTFGNWKVVVGDVRNHIVGPFTQNPLVFFAAPGRDTFFACGPDPDVTVANLGSVDMLDMNTAGSTLPTPINPPPDPGQCAPTNVGGFRPLHGGGRRQRGRDAGPDRGGRELHPVRQLLRPPWVR